MLSSRARVPRRRTRAILSTAGAVAAAAALAAPAGAAVTLPHSIAVFYHRDFVQASGFKAGELVNVTASRNGVVIGTATKVPAIDSSPGLGDGLVTVNHPGGSCWDNFTPDLKPGDVIETTIVGSTAAPDSTAIADVEVTQQATKIGSDVVIKGWAADANGNPLPLSQIQQRMVAGSKLPLFQKNGKRDVRAGANGADGTLVYDPPATNPTGINWTATYTGLSPADQANAVQAETRAIWLGPNPTAINPAGFPPEATFAEVGGDKPALPGGSVGCPGLAPNAVTSLDAAHTFAGKPVINVANQNTDVKLSGVANNADAVSVTLTDANNTSITRPATLSRAAVAAPGAPVSQTWTVTFPAADVKTLADGPVTADGAYTPSGAASPITGTTLSVAKDLVAPGAPTAAIPPGRYDATQSVALSGPDRTATIHHTEDGTSVPDAASPTFNPVPITSSQTISAIAIDPAGNPSPVARFGYTIGALPVVQQIPLLAPLAPAGNVQGATASSPARPAVGRLAVAVLRNHALRATMRLGSGAQVVQLRVYHARNGRPTGRPVMTVLRLHVAGGRYAVTLRNAALRGLRRGRYVLEVRAGATRATLGTPSRQTFIVG